MLPPGLDWGMGVTLSVGSANSYKAGLAGFFKPQPLHKLCG